MPKALTTVAALAAVCASCQPADSHPADLGRDDAGRPIPAPFQAARIVSLAPGHTELLFALGAGDLVVGRTRWGDFPPDVGRVPSVGDGLEPNVEAIVARRPDLVVFYASPANDPAIRRLDELGVASVSLRTDGLEDLRRATRILGSLTNREAVADSLIAWLDETWESLRAGRPPGPEPTVLILAWDDPPIVIGGQSFLSEIVEAAGARNAFGDVDRPSLTVSIETIVERDPSAVLITSDSTAPAWIVRPEWQAVPAVRDRRLVTVFGSEFSRPSFRAPEAVAQLRRAMAERRP